ncbi:MAG: DNA gyrase subunit A, partial [Oscillospiraceae bacterium]
IDPDKLMKKLYRLTPLQDNYSCNFNILINGRPRVMGIYEILNEWILFRTECVRRRVRFDLNKKKDKLHLLKGLKAILLDIDKAVRVVRDTKEETDVISNLMIEFGIDEIQAEYVAEIKLRHLNGEYILNRINEVDQLQKDIDEMTAILADEKKIQNIIITELNDVAVKYGKDRKTKFYYAGDEDDEDFEEEVPDYPAVLFLSKSGYFKKITPQSLRMSGEQKLKDGDEMSVSFEATNKTELLFFTDKAQVYKTKASAFDDTKASVLGDYIPAKLGFDQDENVFAMVITTDYSETLVMAFENGKVAKVPLAAYETKTNRKKLSAAYSDKSALVRIFCITENVDILLKSTNGRAVRFNTGMILPKSTRNTIGVAAMTLKAKSNVETAFLVTEDLEEETAKFRVKTIPAAGCFAKDLQDPEQLTL